MVYRKDWMRNIQNLYKEPEYTHGVWVFRIFWTPSLTEKAVNVFLKQ